MQAAGFVALLGMMSARLGARTTATLSAATLKRLQVEGRRWYHRHRRITIDRPPVSQSGVGHTGWMDGWCGDGGWIGQGVFQLIVAPTVPLRDEIVGLFTSAAASTDQHEQQQGGKYHHRHRHTAITVAACLVGVGCG